MKYCEYGPWSEEILWQFVAPFQMKVDVLEVSHVSFNQTPRAVFTDLNIIKLFPFVVDFQVPML